MKKILFILPNLKAGGAEKVFLNLINLLKDDVKIYLVVFDSSGLLKKIVPKKIQIIDLQTKRLRNSLFKIFYNIIKIKPNIILSSLLHVNIYLLLLNLICIKKYNIILRETNFPYENVKRNRLLFFVYRYLYRLSNNIIASSFSMKNQFIKKFKIPKHKIFHINNPIMFYHQNVKENTINHYNKKIINFLSIGRLTEQKNYKFLIESFAKIKHHNFIVNIYGEGSELGKLNKIIKSNCLEEKIFIRKNILNIKIAYENSNILVVTSKWEGMSNVILEALFCGLIVICSTTSGAINDLISNFSKQIIIYKDQNDFVKILSDLTSSNLIKKRIVNIPQNYNNIQIKDQYLKLFKNF